MSWEILALIVIAVLALVLFLFRKNPYVKKYWKYFLILAPVVVVLILRIINSKSNARKDGKIVESGEALKEAVEEVKEELKEANTVATIEVTAAKAKDAAKVEELKEVVKITDKKKRRKRLAAMLG